MSMNKFMMQNDITQYKEDVILEDFIQQSTIVMNETMMANQHNFVQRGYCIVELYSNIVEGALNNLA